MKLWNFWKPRTNNASCAHALTTWATPAPIKLRLVYNIHSERVGFVIVDDIPVLEAGDSFHLFSRALTVAMEEEVCALACCRDTSTCWVVLLVGSCNRGMTTESSDEIIPGGELVFISWIWCDKSKNNKERMKMSYSHDQGKI